MTPDERANLAYAPELAVIDVLRAAAHATCAALAVAYPSIRTDSHWPEHDLATQIYAAVAQLDRAIADYCDCVLASRQTDDDVTF